MPALAIAPAREAAMKPIIGAAAVTSTAAESETA
jgi:hypothetical protein